MATIPGFIERFWSKVDKSDEGCWEWRGQVRPDGYGSIWDSRLGRKNLAHRIAVELTGRTIPAGMHTDHLCRNRKCVRPDHLEVVTHRENMRRGIGWPGVNARKTRCPNGHPYDGANLVMNVRGERLCRSCRLAANRAWYARNRTPAA